MQSPEMGKKLVLWRITGSSLLMEHKNMTAKRLKREDR